MKVYYRDDSMWIVGDAANESLQRIDGRVRQSIFPTYRLHFLDCAYMRIGNTFKMMKDRQADPDKSRLVQVLKKQGIGLVCLYAGHYQFESTQDEFLFNLKFGAIDV